MTAGPLELVWAIDESPAGPLLHAELAVEARCLSSSVLGGGYGAVRTWVNLQVAPGYDRTDPAAHLAGVTAGYAAPVVGMLTAAHVDRVQDVVWGTARVLATVGLGLPIAAAGLGEEPLPAEHTAGTINIFAAVGTPLAQAGLAGAFITAVEAKAQALAAAGVPATNVPKERRGPATGTASDALAVACPSSPAGGSPFCGPATPHGADLARAVFEAVLRGCAGWGPWERDGSGQRQGVQ